jgi:myo-inositol catabolism protein IolC
MTLGYDKRLYILALDHRGSFERQVLGRASPLSDAEVARIRDAKALIYEGFHVALAAGLPRDVAGVLIDEQFGAEVAHRAHAEGVALAMPVEKSGQDEFDFEYGEEFGDHIRAFDPTFAKVLVRYNPEGDRASNARQAERGRRLSDWLHRRDRKLLFELLIPPTPEQMASVATDPVRYDRFLRPDLMVRAIAQLQWAGVEPDVWKIEGLDSTADCRRVVAQVQSGGRARVGCVVLGRGADAVQVDEWLRAVAPVPGYIGFAIGRSIFSDALNGYLRGTCTRAEASKLVADTYLRFVRVYADAAATPGLPAIREPTALAVARARG